MYLSRLGSAASPYLSLILRMMACFSPFLWLFGPCTWTTHSPFSLHLSLVGTWDLADEDSWFCLDRVPCNWVTLPTNLVDEPREDLPPSSCRLSGGAHLFLFALSVPPFGHCLFCLVRKPHPWVALAKYVRNQLEAIVAVVLRQLANASAAIPCSNCSRVFDPCMLLDASCSTPPAPLYRSVLNGPSVSDWEEVMNGPMRHQNLDIADSGPVQTLGILGKILRVRTRSHFSRGTCLHKNPGFGR